MLQFEIEKALLSGELKSKQLEIEKTEARKQKLVNRAKKIEDSMNDCHVKKEIEQEKCRVELNLAQEHLTQLEKKLKETAKSSPMYEQVFEEFLQAQEKLDTERKSFEDLEFHHLEEEADLLASKEEVQREITDLTLKIENLNTVILQLDQENCDMSKSNSNEYKTIEKQKLECLMRLEEIRNKLKSIDSELLYFNQESEQDISSDSESDKSKDIDSHFSNSSLNNITDMSCSVIISNTKIPEYTCNMSQSFNEKLFQEKSILEIGGG